MLRLVLHFLLGCETFLLNFDFLIICSDFRQWQLQLIEILCNIRGEFYVELIELVRGLVQFL